jgi:hypothetical protein
VSAKRAFAAQFGVFFRDWKTTLIVFLIIFSLSFAAGWIPDGINELFWGNKSKALWMLGSSGAILSALLIAAHCFSKSPEFEAFQDRPKKKRAMMLFLSNLRLSRDKLLEELCLKAFTLPSPPPSRTEESISKR